MIWFLLVTFGILLEVIIIGLGLYLVWKHTKTKSKSVIVTAKVRKSDYSPQIKRNESLPPCTIYTSDTLRETPIKNHSTDLIPYGLSDSDKEILEMFYEKDN